VPIADIVTLADVFSGGWAFCDVSVTSVPPWPSAAVPHDQRRLPRPHDRAGRVPFSWPSRSFPLKGARPTSICHLVGWYLDGITVAENVHQLRLKPGDSEKITINLGYVDLGHIDLMVQEGFYSNRTDFIRTAIRNQLERHADVVKQSTARKHLDLGLRHYSREDLETARSEGEMLHIRVLGLASIGPDVTPELARATVASVVVLGALHASPAVKAALADRMR
jgi:Arc/MetJ-type ribon-helix-helix transcriptional regulator